MQSRTHNNVALKRLFAVAATFFVAACLTIFLAGCNRYYWDYDCSWICENPHIELYQGCGSGQMVIVGEQYDFFTVQANDATEIDFFLVQEDESAEQKLLWRANTVLKDGKLYLTITEDAITNFEGKTLAFEQRIG